MVYQKTISPDKGMLSFWLKGKICAHEPHCSQYSIEILKRYKFFRGIGKIMDRIFRCTGGFQKVYDPSHYKIIFFSSASIGKPFLKQLQDDNKFEVIGVVTTSDKAMGRGMTIQENQIKKYAKEIGIDSQNILTPNNINPNKTQEGIDFIEKIKKLNPDYIIVIAYGKIISQEILDIPKFGAINVHGSLLPYYRGASPIQSVILDNLKQSGITIMKMDATLDTGDIIDIKKFKINFEDTSLDLINKIQDIGPSFLNKTLWNYAKNMLGLTKQNDQIATYCTKIEKLFGLIDIYNTNLEEIYRKYKAFFLWPKIYFFLGKSFGKNEGKRIIIENLEIDLNLYNPQTKLLSTENVLDKSITRLIVKPEGKSKIDRDDFIKGYKL